MSHNKASVQTDQNDAVNRKINFEISFKKC